MKWAVGKIEVEDALQRLDLLTKEENLTMMTAINLEDTHHDVHYNVRATQEVFCDVGSDLMETKLDVIERDLGGINDNVKATKPGMPILSISSYPY